MIKRGFRAKQICWNDLLEKFAEQGSYPPVKTSFDIGYVLMDSTGFILSPTLRKYVAMAWDDILITEESEDNA